MFNQAVLGFFLSLFFIMPAFADKDSGLYNPKISESDHFVRFINNTDSAVSPSLNKKKHEAIEPHQVSPYFLMKSDAINFSTGEYNFKDKIIKSGFYTLVIGKPIELIHDQKVSDRTKAVIAFYNLSGASAVSLKAKQDTVTVFEGLEPASMQSRDINATKIDLSVFKDAEKVTTLPDIILERGQHYSVIFDGKSAHIEQAKIDFKK